MWIANNVMVMAEFVVMKLEEGKGRIKKAAGVEAKGGVQRDYMCFQALCFQPQYALCSILKSLSASLFVNNFKPGGYNFWAGVTSFDHA